MGESMRIDRQNEVTSRNHKRSAEPVKEAATGKDFMTSPAEPRSASKPFTSLPPGGPKPPAMLVQSFPKPLSMLKAEAEARQQAEANAMQVEEGRDNAAEIKEGEPEYGTFKTDEKGQTRMWDGKDWVSSVEGVDIKPGQSIEHGGQIAGATVMESAQMANAVYTGKNILPAGSSAGVEGGWNVSDFELNNYTPENNDIGFQSTLFERMYKSKMEYAYVFRGTDEKIDWEHNIGQAFGTSTQYALAINNAKIIVGRFGVNNVTFIGHSLGGGLATAAALATGAKATIFNPAWISGPTIAEHGLNLSFMKNMTSYVVAGEVLHTAQTAGPPVLKMDGLLHKVDHTVILGSTLMNWMVSNQLGESPIDLHGMEVVIEALKSEKYKAMKYGDYYEH